MYGFADNLVFGLKGFGYHIQGFEAVVVVVGDEFFGGFDSSSERPAAIYHIETIYQYLNMVAW